VLSVNPCDTEGLLDVLDVVEFQDHFDLDRGARTLHDESRGGSREFKLIKAL